jgi:hypothetical protein
MTYEQIEELQARVDYMKGEWLAIREDLNCLEGELLQAKSEFHKIQAKGSLSEGDSVLGPALILLPRVPR